MESLNRVFDTIEGNSRRKTELVGNLLLQELEEIYKIPFMTQMNSSVAQIISLLNGRENNQIKETVIKLLEKYNVNKRGLLLRLTNDFYGPEFWSENHQIDTFATLPYCIELKKDNHHYQIQTEFGLLDLFRLSDYTNSEEVRYALQREDFHKKCHGVVEMFKEEYKNAFITTSKMKNLFVGDYYHSYFELPNHRGVADISCNTFYKGTCFEEVFKPKIVEQYPASELNNRFHDFVKEAPDLENEYYKVLQLVLYSEMKRR